jgi:hypothetical protein
LFGSEGAHIFRVLMANYLGVIETDPTTPFNPSDPVKTPPTPQSPNEGMASDTLLIALSKGIGAMAGNTCFPSIARKTISNTACLADDSNGIDG